MARRVVKLAIFLLVVHALYRFVPVYVRYQQFKDAVHETALFARNGPAVLAVRRSTLVDEGALYGTDVRPLVMAREDSIDVDDAFDLQVAEMLLSARSAGRTLA